MTASKVEILDGEHWLIFRDPEVVTNRQRRPYQRAFARMLKGERPADDADFAQEYATAVGFMLVAEWSLPEPLPSDWDLFCAYLEDEPARVLDAINIEASRYLMQAEQAKVEQAPKARKAPQDRKASAST